MPFESCCTERWFRSKLSVPDRNQFVSVPITRSSRYPNCFRHYRFQFRFREQVLETFSQRKLTFLSSDNLPSLNVWKWDSIWFSSSLGPCFHMLAHEASSGQMGGLTWAQKWHDPFSTFRFGPLAKRVVSCRPVCRAVILRHDPPKAKPCCTSPWHGRLNEPILTR